MDAGAAQGIFGQKEGGTSVEHGFSFCGNLARLGG
jgi:hypothetical protein